MNYPLSKDITNIIRKYELEYSLLKSLNNPLVLVVHKCEHRKCIGLFTSLDKAYKYVVNKHIDDNLNKHDTINIILKQYEFTLIHYLDVNSPIYAITYNNELIFYENPRNFLTQNLNELQNYINSSCYLKLVEINPS